MGVLVLARAGGPETGGSVLDGRRTTCLPKYIERTAYMAHVLEAREVLPDVPGVRGGRGEAVLAERRRSSSAGRSELTHRGTRADDTHAFVVEDGHYVSARWPGDAYLFAKKLKHVSADERRSSSPAAAETDWTAPYLIYRRGSRLRSGLNSSGTWLALSGALARCVLVHSERGMAVPNLKITWESDSPLRQELSPWPSGSDHAIITAHDKHALRRLSRRVLGSCPKPQRRSGQLHGSSRRERRHAGLRRPRTARSPEPLAFLVSEREFDEVFARIRERGLAYRADPHHRHPNAINTRDGGRGLYFEDPNGHNLEIPHAPVRQRSA